MQFNGSSFFLTFLNLLLHLSFLTMTPKLFGLSQELIPNLMITWSQEPWSQSQRNSISSQLAHISCKPLQYLLKFMFEPNKTNNLQKTRMRPQSFPTSLLLHYGWKTKGSVGGVQPTMETITEIWMVTQLSVIQGPSCSKSNPSTLKLPHASAQNASRDRV